VLLACFTVLGEDLQVLPAHAVLRAVQRNCARILSWVSGTGSWLGGLPVPRGDSVPPAALMGNALIPRLGFGFFNDVWFRQGSLETPVWSANRHHFTRFRCATV
jgi:hypothetical protein